MCGLAMRAVLDEMRRPTNRRHWMAEAGKFEAFMSDNPSGRLSITAGPVTGTATLGDFRVEEHGCGKLM